MPIMDHSKMDDSRQVDRLIRSHLVEQAIRAEDSRLIAPVGPAVIDWIACRAEVDGEFVRQRLRTICEQVGSAELIK